MNKITAISKIYLYLGWKFQQPSTRVIYLLIYVQKKLTNVAAIATLYTDIKRLIKYNQKLNYTNFK